MESIFQIDNCRKCFYQWDVGQKLTVLDNSVTAVNYEAEQQEEAYKLPVVNGKAQVPDELLQVAGDLVVWAMVYDGSQYTKATATFGIIARQKPSDYVYTPIEYETFASKLDKNQGSEYEDYILQIDENGEIQPSEVLADYYTADEINNKFYTKDDIDENFYSIDSVDDLLDGKLDATGYSESQEWCIPVVNSNGELQVDNQIKASDFAGTPTFIPMIYNSQTIKYMIGVGFYTLINLIQHREVYLTNSQENENYHLLYWKYDENVGDCAIFANGAGNYIKVNPNGECEFINASTPLTVRITYNVVAGEYEANKTNAEMYEAVQNGRQLRIRFGSEFYNYTYCTPNIAIFGYYIPSDEGAGVFVVETQEDTQSITYYEI